MATNALSEWNKQTKAPTSSLDNGGTTQAQAKTAKKTTAATAGTMNAGTTAKGGVTSSLDSGALAGTAQARSAGTATATARTTGKTATGGVAAGKATMPKSLDEQYTLRQQQAKNQINSIYDNQLTMKQQELKTAYDKNLSDRQAALGQISPQYQKQANAMAIQYEKNRRNANMNALNSGLNIGTAQQQQNALNQNYIGNYTDLRNQEASALTAAKQGITQLKQDYRNNLNNAQMDIDTKRNQALIEDQQKQQTWYDQQAATLAQYGDFSGYEKLYGKKQAQAMKNMWITQNPIQAFRMGYLNEEQFKKLTGRDIKEVGFADTYQSVYNELGKQ